MRARRRHRLGVYRDLRRPGPVDLQLQDFGADRRRLLYGARTRCASRGGTNDRCRDLLVQAGNRATADAGYQGRGRRTGGHHASVYTLLFYKDRRVDLPFGGCGEVHRALEREY